MEQKDGVPRLRLIHPNLPSGDHDGLRLGRLARIGVLDFKFCVGERRHRDAEAQSRAARITLFNTVRSPFGNSRDSAGTVLSVVAVFISNANSALELRPRQERSSMKGTRSRGAAS